MSDFSPADAAFEGFKLPREHPRAVLIWTGVLFLSSLAVNAAMIGLGGDEYAAFFETARSGQPNPEVVEALVQRVFPIVFPVGLLTLAVFSSAVYRQYIRPSESSFGFLRIGVDELRVAALVLIYIGLAALYVFVVALAGGLLARIVSLANGGLGAFVGFLWAVGALCFTVYLFVRLSLAAPQTFAERRLAIFDSWSLTGGHFWKMFGAYFLSFALVAIVWLLALAISQGLLLLLHGLNVEAASGGPNSFRTLAAYFSPQTVVVLAFNAFLNALFYGLMFSPGTVIYQELVQSGGRKRPAEG